MPACSPRSDYFNIDLRQPPYSLSNPAAVYSEETPGEVNKLQLLYNLDELREANFEAMRQGCGPIMG